MDPVTFATLLSAAVSLFGSLAGSFGGKSRQGGQQNQSSQFGLPEGGMHFPKYGQQGMDTLNQLMSMGLQGWQQNQPQWGPVEAEARNNWNTQAVPLLAERFGGMGARNSSAYEGSLSNAQKQFELGLNAQKQQFGQQNRNQLLQMLQLGLLPQYESAYKTRQPGFGENLAVAALPAAIQYAPQIIDSWNGKPAQAGEK